MTHFPLLLPRPGEKADLHMHTNICDGRDSAEEMVLSAIEKGLDCVGICAHAYVDFDTCCIPLDKYEVFLADCARLKEKYAPQIKVLCGVEQDIYSSGPTDGFDYILGSVHYLKVEDEYIPVDLSPEVLIAAAEKHFGGDLLALIEAYYETEAKVFAVTHCDIIAHFDLISKFNEGQKLFCETDARVIRAYQAAADALLACGKPFEVNTGAISRGCRTTPYPSSDIYSYLAAKGGRFILSSDAHRRENIAYEFDKWQQIYAL